jgi:hypothetical protein
MGKNKKKNRNQPQPKKQNLPKQAQEKELLAVPVEPVPDAAQSQIVQNVQNSDEIKPVKKYHKKPENFKIINALIASNGKITGAAAMLKCFRHTLKKWLDEDEDLRLGYEIAQGNHLEWVHGQHMKLMEGVWVENPMVQDPEGNNVVYKTSPCWRSVQYELDHQGKDLGYGKKFEKSTSIKVNTNVSQNQGQQQGQEQTQGQALFPYMTDAERNTQFAKYKELFLKNNAQYRIGSPDPTSDTG